MTTDRKLLEAAALAAGLNVFWHEDLQRMVFAVGSASRKPTVWNPLTDDGDAFRLAVRLNITTGFDMLPDGAIAYASAEHPESWDRGYRVMEWLNKDPLAATRRAIVRAAAAMGARNE